MKTRLLCLSFWIAVMSQAGTGVISDGKSLLEGLTLYEKSQAGRSITWEETAIAVSAASYAQGFASSCFVWQTKEGSKAPFDLPHGLTAEQLIKVFQKYLTEHPTRLHERANLLFDATTRAFPHK